MRLPSAQFTHTQSQGGSYPNPALPWSGVVWQHSAIRQSYAEPHRILLPAGRYDAYVEVAMSGSNTQNDYFAQYSLDNGATWSVFTRHRPADNSTDLCWTARFSFVLAKEGDLQVRTYKSSASSNNMLHRLTVVMTNQAGIVPRQDDHGLLRPDRPASMQAFGSLAVATTTYPPAANQPFTSANWRDSAFVLEPSNPAEIRILKPGPYIIDLQVFYAGSANTTDVIVEYLYNSDAALRLWRLYGFQAGGGAPLTFNVTLCRWFNHGDRIAFRNYHITGSTRTITHTMTLEEI